MECPHCGHEMEMAEYLDTESGLASEPVCMNPECWDVLVEKDKVSKLGIGLGWTKEETAENIAFLRKLSPHLVEAVLEDLHQQVIEREMNQHNFGYERHEGELV